MKQIIDSFLEFIVTDLFTGYGLYTLAFVLYTLVRKPGKMLTSWDDSANLLVRWAGVVLLLGSIYSFASAEHVQDEPINWYPWMVFVAWIVASQLLWINVFRVNKLLRLVVGFVLFLSMEKFVIFITSFYRDYIPSGWVTSSSTTGYWIAITLALITKAVTFVVFIYVLTYLRSRWEARKINQ